LAANEAYSDIVRFGNVRYAMLQHLRKPPKDFEDAIRLHFSLRKPDILALCEVSVAANNASGLPCELEEASHGGVPA